MKKEKIGFDVNKIPCDNTRKREDFMIKWQEAHGLDEDGKKKKNNENMRKNEM